jgi:hypothetical protein
VAAAATLFTVCERVVLASPRALQHAPSRGASLLVSSKKAAIQGISLFAAFVFSLAATNGGDNESSVAAFRFPVIARNCHCNA